MTIKIPSYTPFTPVNLIISAEVRYWEDATVNGEEDSEGILIPLRTGPLWCPTIELATGRVLRWPEGFTARIHYKVCDAGEYWLSDINGKRAKHKGDYVPRILSVGDDGFGDYIILTISADGLINGWKESVIDSEDWALETTKESDQLAADATVAEQKN